LPVRIKISRPARRSRGRRPSRLGANVSRILFWSLSGSAVVLFALVCFTYSKYARLTDEKLAHGPFPNSSMLFAAPGSVAVGDPGTLSQVTYRLRESGYSQDARSNPLGWYHLRPDAIEIFPGDRSFTSSEPGVVHFADGKISSIIALSDNSPRTEYTLEPQLLTTLYDKNRQKRRLFHYDDIPPVMVEAVVSIEDKRFFQHSGFDPIGIARAVYVDLKEHRKDQGASTITQQLARNIWLDSRKKWTRKFDELLITIHLEQKLSKQKIFEYYANEVDLGRRGSFAIRGFGEASQAYFGKDLRQITLPEAATLAGLIQRPSPFNPVRWPDRAKSRRNVVLKQMLDNGYISPSQYSTATQAAMVTSQQGVESADAPYFLDMVNEQLADQFQDHDFQESGSNIYTTLDPDLQRDAAAAVATGMREVDALLAKRRKGAAPVEAPPQVALICLDPRSGEVKALIGGRNYGVSQLNHALAKRPSGSIFKPFVYAAALNSGLGDHPTPMTASTVVPDEPRSFDWAGGSYEPTDYHKNAWAGDVTLRTAFIKSLNVPTIEVAEETGYNVVADLAHKAGLSEVRATPAMALGAYNVTPLDMAGAYTIFANKGVMVHPQLISRIVGKAGNEVWSSRPQTNKVLDPRVNYIILSFMQDVLRMGTGAGVRARGFTMPAAGKTGTENDAWFAGFTSNLLCVVWVGLDNYHDLKLEGAQAALPVWVDFMKRAHQHRAYRNVSQFEVPDGVVNAQIDSATGQLATNACPLQAVKTEYYLLGTQPLQFCPAHMGGSEIAGWQTLPSAPPMGGPVPMTPVVPVVASFPSGNPAGSPTTASSSASNPAPQTDTEPEKDKKEKKGFLDKLKGIFH
jgi:penicillin-binding protein 1B